MAEKKKYPTIDEMIDAAVAQDMKTKKAQAQVSGGVQRGAAAIAVRKKKPRKRPW